MDLEKLLTRVQKEEVIRHLIRENEPKAQHFSLKYDRRFGWDFEVRRHGLRPIVTFSVSVTDERLGFVAQECARAIREIQESTHAIAILGQRNIVEA